MDAAPRSVPTRVPFVQALRMKLGQAQLSEPGQSLALEGELSATATLRAFHPLSGQAARR